MTQTERRIFLLQSLLREQPAYASIQIPEEELSQKKLLRSLMNVRTPKMIDSEFLRVQDAYLQAEIIQKGVTKLSDLKPIKAGLYLWKGDITTLCLY